MKKLIPLCLFILVSCGSQNTDYVKLSPDILDGLKRKQQKECLVKKKNLYHELLAKGKTAFDTINVKNTWKITYTETDKTSSNSEEKSHTITIYLTEKNSNNSTLIFGVRNENSTDGNPNDYKAYTYTLENQKDHINLILGEACLGEKPNFSSTQISFHQEINSSTRAFLYLSEFPAFFSRYTSYIQEIRDGDSVDSKGDVQTLFKATAPSKEPDTMPAEVEESHPFHTFSSVPTQGGVMPGPPMNQAQCLTSVFGFYSGKMMINPACR